MPKAAGRLFILFVTLLTIAAGPAEAEAFLVEPVGYNLDLPIGWVPVEIGDSGATFAGPDECAYLQVKVFPGETFREAAEISSWAIERLSTSGDEIGFDYSGHDAVFRTLSFSKGNFVFNGYAVCIDGEEEDFFISSFTSDDLYEDVHDFLLSSLDSFALDESDRKMPGPVSQFYAGSFGQGDPRTSYIDFSGRIAPFSYDGNELEAAKVLILREARILSAYAQSGGVEAWKRYYRMLYRDSFIRLQSVADAFYASFADDTTGPFELAEILLGWVQSFEYARPGDVSDIYAPMEAAALRAGDCDSRGLLYTILLEMYGIDAILLVSSRYAHSMVGVDVEGPGARFECHGRGYLVAETSDNVSIGLIAADMADPAGWIAVDLGSSDFLLE